MPLTVSLSNAVAQRILSAHSGTIKRLPPPRLLRLALRTEPLLACARIDLRGTVALASLYMKNLLSILRDVSFDGAGGTGYG